jgi:hypothetical protein
MRDILESIWKSIFMRWFYAPDHRHLFDLGFRPGNNAETKMGNMLRE